MAQTQTSQGMKGSIDQVRVNLLGPLVEHLIMVRVMLFTGLAVLCCFVGNI